MALSSAAAVILAKSSPPVTAATAGAVSLEKVTVKQERPDDAEIRELAAKMVEANKAKMGSAISNSGTARPTSNIISQPNLPGILGYLSPTNAKRAADSSLSKNLIEGKLPPDDDSQRGRFGWTSFGKCHIPYIYRAGEKYCAVRILESKLLNKYLGYLHADIYSCTCIRSYYITEAESKLFNEINIKHCENQFGRDPFTCKDLVVRLADAKEFYTFLDMCYTKLTAGNVQNTNNIGGLSSSCGIQMQKAEKCGFIRINKESVVPYTVKDGLKYVPLFYFEGETDNLKLKAEKLEGWDLSYLKFCCKVQGIRNELFASETCSVISLSDIKSYFPPGTGFEDYWPSKVMDSQLLVSSKGGGAGGGWTKQPPTPPTAKQSSVIGVQNNTNKNSMNVRGASGGAPMQSIVPRGSSVNTSNATIQRVGQSRPVVTTHPAHSSPSRVSPGRNSSVPQQQMLNAVQAACNGWPGLVGGQPAFQTALVSQASQVIRMTNASLNMHNQIASSNKSYSQQSRSRGGGSTAGAQYPGVYPVTTMQAAAQAQPPPLVRATAHSSQPNIGYPTYGKDDWATTTYTAPGLGVPGAVSPSTYPHNMLSLSVDQVHAALMPPTQSMLSHPSRHTPPGHNSTTAKYPPPLIPVNGSSNNVRDSRGRKPLIPIGDTPTSGSHVPYKVQKALVDEKMVPCINAKPYIYTELLMTLPDFVSQYFPSCDINSCRQVLTDVLGVDLYQGNRQQMQMLMEAGKCSSINEELPLIQVRNIMKFMPQMKYMFNPRNTGIPAPAHSSSEEHPAKKRQRTS